MDAELVAELLGRSPGMLIEERALGALQDLEERAMNAWSGSAALLDGTPEERGVRNYAGKP